MGSQPAIPALNGGIVDGRLSRRSGRKTRQFKLPNLRRSRFHSKIEEFKLMKTARPPSKEYMETMSKLHPNLSLPPPQLEVDFRMRVVLSTTVATMATESGSKDWTTFREGVWSGSLGTGSVVVRYSKPELNNP